MLKRAVQRLKISHTSINDPHSGWEYIPKNTASGSLRPVDYNNRTPVPSSSKLRGSGVHGPENADVMKLILWNRLKQRQPQMEVPSLHHLQESYKFEGSLIYFTIAWVAVLMPVYFWGNHYASIHDHYPWMPPRRDGTKGTGVALWFLQ
jgi:hypothetical protein